MRSSTKRGSPARVGVKDSSLPLATLLSQVLVAFTIEFDNETEHQMQHRTTKHGSKGAPLEAPWLVSLVMWSNCMQYIGEKGVRVRELETLARTKTNLNGMERWGYIAIEPDPADRRPKPPRSDWVIRATPAGRKAQEVWRPLFSTIEKRWEERFSKEQIEQLRQSLWALIRRIDVDLPDGLPILGYALVSKGPDTARSAAPKNEDLTSSSLSLPALLSRVLLAFAIEYENESDLSLAISANVLRVLGEQGVLLRDLPLLSGGSKEAISMAMGILQKKQVAVIEPDATGSRAKVARLTPKGREAQDTYRQLLRKIEERWQLRFGKDAIRSLRKSLEQLVGEPTSEDSPLFRGLQPYTDGWRASVRKPNTLPHFPLVLHRGGFPDGS
jgi:DNA-binding MarR family transcriptional regulator